MKTKLLISALLMNVQMSAFAADLLQVYQKALANNPTFQQAIYRRLSTNEGVPISLSSILPSLQLTSTPSVQRIGYAGSNYVAPVGAELFPLNPRNQTERGNTLALTLTQTVFNFAQFFAIAQQLELAKGADATLNAALQNLMVTVTSAYLAILEDEDKLQYAEESKAAYARQLSQVKQLRKVGLKTVTDVFTAQASYDSAVSTCITAKITLANDRENLREITGEYYSHLSSLSDQFPLTPPKSHDVEEWVKLSLKQNWSIKASRYNTEAAREVIHQQESGHLPTVSVQGSFQRQQTNYINDYNIPGVSKGPGTISDRAVQLNITVPILAGGAVIAQTKQAVYNYEDNQQQLEQTIYSTINTTRQSYQSIVLGIEQIQADKRTVASTISSLEGLQLSYRVGTETLVDVLNQQQKVLQAQIQYVTDFYAYVNNVITLKQAAGTLSFEDLRALNHWMHDKDKSIS